MTPSPAVPAAAAAAVLAPTEQENYVARRVADIVAREHYRRAPLDDHLSSLILDRLSRCHRRRQKLFLRERTISGIRALSL